MLDVIKEYLVSLGFSVDKNSYSEATKAMDEAGHSVSKFAGSAVTKFALAGAAVTSFAVAAVVGIAKYLNELGNASIENEKLARQMWTTEQNAMALNSTLKAMGVTLQDLYLSPTLMSQFQQLRAEAVQLQAPSGYKDEIKLVQAVSFEFKRMKLEATYALQWIGYYLIKYMSGPITEIDKRLKGINDTIIKTMPHWTKTVAQVMSWFAQFGITTVRAIKDVVRGVEDAGELIPRNLKLIGAALTVLGIIIETGPLGILIAIFTAAILLLNDFYTYLDGGESQFGPFWQKLIGFFDKLKDDGAIGKFKKNFKEAIDFISGLIDSARKNISNFFGDLKKNGTLDNLKQAFQTDFDIIKKIFDDAKTWVDDLYTELGKQGVLKDLNDNFENVLKSASELYNTVSDLVDKLLGLKDTETSIKNIGDLLNNVIIVALRIINGLLEGIAGFFHASSSVLNGNAGTELNDSGNKAAQRLNSQSADSGGFWSRMGQTLNEILTDTFTGGTNSQDKILRVLSNVSKALGPNNNNANPNYVYPTSNTSNSNNKITVTQTNNIYGTSDPKATADAANSNLDSLLQRNLQGVTR